MFTFQRGIFPFATNVRNDTKFDKWWQYLVKKLDFALINPTLKLGPQYHENFKIWCSHLDDLGLFWRRLVRFRKFMHNNDPKHAAKLSNKLLQNNSKKPEMANTTSDFIWSTITTKRRNTNKWNNICSQLLENLMGSISARSKAIIKAKGGYIK